MRGRAAFTLGFRGFSLERGKKRKKNKKRKGKRKEREGEKKERK